MTIVAACQLRLAVGDRIANARAVEASVREAARAGSRLVVVPELASSGYVFTDAGEARSLAERMDGPTVGAWRELAGELGLVLVAGFCELGDDDLLYNSAVVIDRGEVVAVYRKAHLWDAERVVFTPGNAPPPVVDTSVGRVGVMVCYDLEFPEWVRLVALSGAEIVAAPTNWPRYPRPDGERPMEVVRVQAAASVNRMYLVAADRCGDERGVSWVGGSVIVDPDGFPLAGPVASDREQVLVAEVDPAAARDKAISPRNDVLADRRVDLYRRAEEPLVTEG